MSQLRLKGKAEHNQVALTVIYFLGGIAVLATAWSGYLIHEAVVSDNAIDSAAVALVGQMVSIATLALGALGAMLSSTSPKPPPPPLVNDSTPVTVVNATSDPVPTASTTDPTDDAPADEPPADEGDGAPIEEPEPEPPARKRR